ncbi:MAG: response regulator [Spirochaetales bacterium]|nr:response regulator [Spirochaetales bacterium]
MDDSPENIDVLVNALKTEGYRLLVSRNGFQAIESVKASPPDLILMDIQMPKMDGYTACEEIKKIQKYRSIPVIFLSGMNVFFNKKKAFDAGGIDYILKPFDIDELKIRVKTHLDFYYSQQKLKRMNVQLLQMFKSAFDQTTVAMVHIDTKSKKILRVNHYFTQLFGYSWDEISGTSVFDIVDDQCNDCFTKLFENDCGSELEIRNCECRCLTKNKNELWAQINLTLIKDQSGNPDFFHLVFEDITKQIKNRDLLNRANQELKKSIDEKEVLIKELYHRTKNNMQVIASMIHLKAACVDEKNDQTCFILRDIESKIYSMSLVHKLLYRSDNLSFISMKEYVQELIILFKEVYAGKNDKLKIEYSVKDFSIIIDVALPIGLILSELLTNSYKHGFPGKTKGEIVITLSKEEDSILCTYKDDGIGMDENSDPLQSGTIGMLIVKNLVEEQLLGSIQKLPSEKGISYSMCFHTQMYVARV